MPAIDDKRVFLDWSRLPLDAATDWLAAEFGENLSGVLVALPGARSGRLLEEKLARKIGKGLRPPKIVTAGLLSDELLELTGPVADRLTRTLAWAAALRALDSSDLSRIAARAPEPDDSSAWWRLAEVVRGLFGEVAAEGLDFGAIAKHASLPASEGERRRWAALAATQEAMTSQLAKTGATDPHLERQRAIADKRLVPAGRVILIGVVEMNALLRSALDLSESEITPLVFAPTSDAASFDEYGCLRSDVWSQRNVSLPLDSWRVADRPGDQADGVLREIAAWKGEFSANDITIGLANPEVGPFIRRRLADHEVVGRDAAGIALSSTGPVRLLELTGRFLRTQRFQDFAGLVRHADFEVALRRLDPKLEAISLVDDYHNRHLPELVDGKWLAKGSSKHDRNLRDRMQQLWTQCLELFGELRRDPEAPAAELRQFLSVVYGDEPLDARVEEERVRLIALRKIAETLGQFEALPSSLAPSGGLQDILDLVQRLLRNEIVPPAGAALGEDTIEMLGWLELPLDDAPALIVAGFEDGHVPESVRGDAFLPNSLRRSLGLVDDDKRLARDLYATELLAHSRTRIAFISGRRSVEGDPRVPSRIVFHCPETEVVPRVKRFLEGAQVTAPRIQDSATPFVLPHGSLEYQLERMSVTDFRTYLRSPYQYYLAKVLGLKTLDDRAREMDPLAFGNLGHDVLQRFGQDAAAREEKDPKAITRFLSTELRKLAREIYGERPLPAVHLQIEQLEHRLRLFADKQAARRARGWQIVASEWTPAGGCVAFDVDGTSIELHGRIDRIDFHPERKVYAIWDYKTGDTLARPGSAHRKTDGTWRDLQLPLYCILAAELIGDEPPDELGYISLCKKPNEVGFDSVKTWGGKKTDDSEYLDGIAAGYEAALDVVRAIREGKFIDPEGFDPREEILRAIGGLDLVEALATDEEEVE